MVQLSNYTVPANATFGWVDQPNQRGTMDVIWSCLLVVFTSTWTVLHIHLPMPDESYWITLLRKTRWSIFTVFAPEGVTLLAACQKSSAQKSVKEMHALGVDHWTTVHGFFADSGGFMLHPPDSPPFPINTRAIHYLIKGKYLDAPTVSKKELWDRSKADRFAKIVAIVQSTYLVVQCIARPIQGLKVSCLELTSVAYVLCTATSYFFWIDKPLGVETTIELPITTPMATILREAGNIARFPYKDTPMDFVEQPGWSAWKRRPLFQRFGGLSKRPIQRIPNDFISPDFSMRVSVAIWALTVVHAGIHLAGWNFDYPTVVERWLWRCSSSALLGVQFIFGFVAIWSIKPEFDFKMTAFGFWKKDTSRDTIFRRYGVDIPASATAAIYFLARMALLAESFASLRHMNGTVFTTVDWSEFIPHF